MSRQEIAAIGENQYLHVSYNARNEKITGFDAFINRMQPADIMVTTRAGDFLRRKNAGHCI